MGNVKSGASVPIISNLSGMGNVQQEFENFVGDSPLRLMNEDTFLIVLKYLTVQDYVQLSTLCHKFEQLFGQNNYFWAQVCEGYVRPPLDYDEYIGNKPEEYQVRPETVAQLIMDTRPGQVVMIDKQRLVKDTVLNLRDKSLVSRFDFQAVLKDYYFRYLHSARLKEKLSPYTRSTNAQESHVIYSYCGKFGNDTWWRPVLRYAKDIYYEVDFKVNPEKLEQLLRPGPGPSPYVAPLPFQIGGRLVVYKKSDVEPRRFQPRIISRSPNDGRPKERDMNYIRDGRGGKFRMREESPGHFVTDGYFRDDQPVFPSYMMPGRVVNNSVGPQAPNSRPTLSSRPANGIGKRPSVLKAPQTVGSGSVPQYQPAPQLQMQPYERSSQYYVPSASQYQTAPRSLQPYPQRPTLDPYPSLQPVPLPSQPDEDLGYTKYVPEMAPLAQLSLRSTDTAPLESSDEYVDE